MKQVIKFAVIKPGTHEFKDCLHRVRRLKEQLEHYEQYTKDCLDLLPPGKSQVQAQNCPQLCLAMLNNFSVNVTVNCN